MQKSKYVSARVDSCSVNEVISTCVKNKSVVLLLWYSSVEDKLRDLLTSALNFKWAVSIMHCLLVVGIDWELAGGPDIKSECIWNDS